MRKIKPDVKAKKKTTMGSWIRNIQQVKDESHYGRRCRLPLKMTSENLQKNQRYTGGETPTKYHDEHSVKNICL